MAYLDDMATEREKTRAKMLEGKTPLLGEDTSRALHALGVSLGVVPAGSPPGRFEQLLASLVGPVKGVKVDDYKSPQYNPQSGTRAASGGGGGGYSGGGGDGLSGLSDMMSKAKDSALAKLLEEKRKAEQSRPASAPGSTGHGASVRDRSVSGAAARAQHRRDTTPGPYAKGEAATQWAREQIPGLKPDDSSGGVTSTANAYMTEKTPGPGVKGVERGAATGDRIVPGADLKGVDPRVAEIVGAAAEGLPAGYKVKPTSGVRATGHGQHTKAAAADWQIIDPDGKPISNRGDDTTGLYTKLAKNAYGYQEKNHPELTGKFQWGGQFGTSAAHPDEPDLMHFDIGGRRGRITKYSRESIGAELPPAAKGAVATPPAWDKGLPKQANPKTAWADPHKTTLPGSDQLETAPPAAPAASRTAGLSPELIKHVKYWEARGGFDAKAYPDGKQYSIGYGTKANSPDEVIDQAEADRRLISELTKAQGEVDKILPANTPANVRDALTSLTMNVGPGWTTEEGGRLRAAVTSGNWRDAAEVIKEYNHADGKEVKGLTVRRGDESRMILGSPSSAPAQAAVPASPPRDPTQALYGDTVRGYQGAPGAAPPVASQQTAAVTPEPGAVTRQPAPVTPPPTQRAPAPTAAPPPAPAPQPPAPKGPTGVQKANTFLDTKAIDLIRRDAPENDTFINRQYIGDRTVRQMMSDPIASGKMKEALPLAAKKYGFTPQDFDAAMHGKRAEGGPAQTSDQLLAQAQGQSQPGQTAPLTQVAQADTGVVNDAGPQGAVPKEEVVPGKPDEMLKKILKEHGDFNWVMPKHPLPDTPENRAAFAAENERLLRKLAKENPDMVAQAGTLDPARQPAVQDAHGNISTVRTIGINDNGREVNIPTVPLEGGRIMSNDEAVQRYRDTGNHLGKYDTPEAAGAAAEALHQREAGAISQHPKGVQPTLPPDLIKALQDVFKDESRVPQAAPPPPDSQPVLPSQVAPMPQAPPGGGGGGLSLAPNGLNGPGSDAGAQPGATLTQGAPIAMAGLMPLPPIQDTSWTPPSTNLSPIPWDTVNGWGGGFDFGGGGFGGFGGF